MAFYDILLIMLSGAFGGFLSSLHINEGKIIPPKRIKLDETDEKGAFFLGVWNDIILGAGAGLIGSLPLGLEFPKYLYVAIIAGFGGGSFIAAQAKQLSDKKLTAESKLPDLPSPAPGSPESVEVELEIDTTDITDTEEGVGSEKENNPNK